MDDMFAELKKLAKQYDIQVALQTHPTKKEGGFVFTTDKATSYRDAQINNIKQRGQNMSYEERQTASGLKVGDTVRIMRSAKHMERDWGNVWNQDMDEYIGRVGKIEGIMLNGLTIEGCATFRFPYFVLKKEEDFETADKVWEFVWKDLASSKTVWDKLDELKSTGEYHKIVIKEEGNMDYTTGQKELTLKDLLKEYDSVLCVEWKDILIHDFGPKYGYLACIPLEAAIKYAKEHNKLEWLIENGYIVEEKKEITYKIGDWFEAHGEKYWLVQVGNATVNLIDFESANRKTDPVEVGNIYKITQKEFNKLGDHMESFKKINVEIKEVP